MDDKGFTLVELVVSILLLTVLLAAAVNLLPPVGISWTMAADKTEAQQHGRIAMEEIIHELTFACSVISDPDAGSLTYFKKRKGRMERYRIYRKGRSLLLDIPGGPAVPIAGCIEDFSCYPQGALKAGEMLTVCLTTEEKGQNCFYRSGVVSRNIEVVQ